MICSVYKSSKHDGMYLYVDKTQGLSRVPEALLNRFGEPKAAMTLLLREGRKLANADSEKVLAAIETDGFYLQMPQQKEDAYMTDIHKKNSKFL
jgi:uncharacterized protein